MAVKRKRVTLHPIKEDGSIDTSVNLYPKTLVDGVVDREGNAVDIATQQELDSVNTHLNDKIDNETQRAELAESSLDTKIDNKETGLKGLIDDEEDRAQAAELNLSTAISNFSGALVTETSRAQNAENHLHDMIEAEESRAEAAEAQLSEDIQEVADSIEEVIQPTVQRLEGAIQTETASFCNTLVRRTVDCVIFGHRQGISY